MPWNGRQELLIDRFDGRALMDFIREYNPRNAPRQEPTDEQIDTDNLVAFYSYRNLVKFRVKKSTLRQSPDSSTAGWPYSTSK